MLTEYGGNMRPDDEVLAVDLADALTHFATELAAAAAFVAESTGAAVVSLKAAAEDLSAEVAEVAAECASGRFDDAEQDEALACEALSEFAIRVRIRSAHLLCPFTLRVCSAYLLWGAHPRVRAPPVPHSRGGICIACL